MIEVKLPTTDVNSDFCKIVEWCVEDESLVGKGTLLCCAETSKATFDVIAPEEGYLLHAATEQSDVALDSPLGHIFDSLEKLAKFKVQRDAQRAKEAGESSVRISVKARKLAEENNIDLKQLEVIGLITTRHVEEAIRQKAFEASAESVFPLEVGAHVRQRILLIGAGYGATQVFEILDDYDEVMVVGLVDDAPKTWGSVVRGAPVLGPASRLKELFEVGRFDAAIVTISTSVPARIKFRKLCSELNIPLANAIDKTCRISPSAILGLGNVFCAFCHVGAETVVGDNNFISAYNSYDHHCVIGDDCSTGPACVSSGVVKIGSRVRMGMNVSFEPYVEIGDGVLIASGATLLSSVSSLHAVKRKMFTTEIVPL